MRPEQATNYYPWCGTKLPPKGEIDLSALP